jgi:hypothetical protein
MRGQSRRSFLGQTLFLPIATCCDGTRGAAVSRVICEPNCLSQESALGFSSILPRAKPFVILAGASAVTRQYALDLRREAARGTWVIWESSPVHSSREQRDTLRQVFGLSVAERISLSPAHEMYVKYLWPRLTLTRTFLAVVPVICKASEAIAHHSGIPVAAKRRIGAGGIVVLGSMLGPNLRAGEREAMRLTAEMFRLLGSNSDIAAFVPPASRYR